ncbi:UNVERIFIED_CONTAM: hypothetical protein NCL1_10775 [Trichonephila clavipes]
MTRFVTKSPRVAEQCDANILSHWGDATGAEGDSGRHARQPFCVPGDGYLSWGREVHLSIRRAHLTQG